MSAGGSLEEAGDEDLRRRFLDGMGRLAATVTVLTTDGPAGRGGLTVSAMASVSADGPTPVLLACVNHAASAAPLILANRVFCLNVLRTTQDFIADVFAARTQVGEAERFECAGWQAMPSGAPRLTDALVAFDCRVLSEQRIGTHHLLIAAVEEIHHGAEGEALLYSRRAYGRAAPLV